MVIGCEGQVHPSCLCGFNGKGYAFSYGAAYMVGTLSKKLKKSILAKHKKEVSEKKTNILDIKAILVPRTTYFRPLYWFITIIVQGPLFFQLMF